MAHSGKIIAVEKGTYHKEGIKYRQGCFYEAQIETLKLNVRLELCPELTK